MNNNKGFTLVELIAVLAIMSILFTIGISTFKITNNSEEDTKKANVNTVEKAINVYYKILSQKGKLNYANDGSETTFCVSYENLVKNGYITEEKIPTYEETDESGNVIQTKYKYASVIIKNNNLEFTNTSDSSNCQKEKTNITPIKNKSGSKSEGDDSTGEINAYSFTSTINQTSENTYKVDSKFKMTITQNIDITAYRPIFTFMVLDRSGSMGGTPIKNAVAAIKNLTSDLEEENSAASPNPDNPDNKPVYCTSVVDFENSASVETYFTHKKITPSTNTLRGTVYHEPLMLINDTVLSNISSYVASDSNMCKTALNNNPLYFILFLSDGAPFDKYGIYNRYDEDNGIVLKNYTEKLKQKGVYMFTISYGQTNNTHLKCMASKVLGENETYVDSDYKLCDTYSDASKLRGYNASGSGTPVYYFESSQTEGSLTEIFKTFSTVAKKEARKTDYDKVNITFSINTNYFNLETTDGNNKEFKNTISIDSMDTQYLTSKNDFNIVLINDKFEDKEVKLFNSITLEFIDDDKKVENRTVEVPENQLPKVNVYKYKDTLIN
jgi:prepilin-type N-terminal cleavage/methylation domain-containing protein